MNIFILDKDPVKAAKYHCDKHVVKMVVELFQQLGSAVIRNGVKQEKLPLTSKNKPIKGGYHNHPCTRWCGDSRFNYIWAATHAVALCKEYTYRYCKTHSCQSGIIQLSKMSDVIQDGELTPFALAMPDEYKCEDAVKSYRNYYLNNKRTFARWEKLNNTPYWWK
jgi:hypothetical protein